MKHLNPIVHYAMVYMKATLLVLSVFGMKTTTIVVFFASDAFAMHEKVDENEHTHGDVNICWSSMCTVDVGVPELKKSSKELAVEHKLSVAVCSCLEPKLRLSTASKTSANVSVSFHRDNTSSFLFDGNS